MSLCRWCVCQPSFSPLVLLFVTETSTVWQLVSHRVKWSLPDPSEAQRPSHVACVVHSTRCATRLLMIQCCVVDWPCCAASSSCLFCTRRERAVWPLRQRQNRPVCHPLPISLQVQSKVKARASGEGLATFHVTDSACENQGPSRNACERQGPCHNACESLRRSIMHLT